MATYEDTEMHWLTVTLLRVVLFATPFIVAQIVSMYYSMGWAAWTAGAIGLICGSFVKPRWYMIRWPQI